MKSLKEFDCKKLSSSEINYVNGGGCGTTYTIVSSGQEGSDTYFDVNDNGVLDAGDLVDLDNGQTIVKK